MVFSDPPVPEVAAPAGLLPGGLSVSGSGAASYEVPLEVPAGPGGVQPRLSLGYTNGGGNGLLGVGWSVSGALSSVSRCGKSLSVEDKTTGVKYVNSDSASGGDADRFCLNGQKLVVVGPGSYGASWTTYHTEAESRTKVVSRDSDAGGPKWFEVWTDDGRHQRYEAAASADPMRYTTSSGGIMPTATVRDSWVLKSESDRSGNVMTYSYSQVFEPIAGLAVPGAKSVEVVVDKIAYSTVSGAGQRRYVQFNYSDDRPDVEFSWQSGVRKQTRKRLVSLEMFAPNPKDTALVWKYSFDYNTEGSTGRSRLAKVTRCGFKGGCTWSKKFTYSAGLSSYAGSVLESGFELRYPDIQFDMPSMQVADFNGDGADDYIYSFGHEPGSGNDYIRLGVKAAGSGLITALQDKRLLTGVGNYDTRTLAQSRPADLDGDGLPELVALHEARDGSDTTHVDLLHWDSAANRFSNGSSRGTFTYNGPAEPDFGDFNGDGLLDAVGSIRHVPYGDSFVTEWGLQLNAGTGFGSVRPLLTSDCKRSMVDVDGDGRIDVFAGRTNTSSPYLDSCGDGVGVTASLRDDGYVAGAAFSGSRYPADEFDSEALAPGDNQLEFGDFNGDGLQDAAQVRWVSAGGPCAGPCMTVRYNTGNGFAPEEVFTELPNWPVEGMWGDKGLKIADMNSDGRDDFVLFHEQATAMPVAPRVWRGSATNIAGITILYAGGGFKTLVDAANPDKLHDFDGDLHNGGWGLSKIGDFSGDGFLDIVTYKGNGVANQLMVYVDKPSDVEDALGDPASAIRGDLLTKVWDSSNSKWPLEHISYSTEWSNQPRVTAVPAVSFPTMAGRHRGMTVVRSVASRAHLLDPADDAAVRKGAHVTEYAYENPVSDVWGRGFLGFSKTFTWNKHRPSETVTDFDNHTRIAGAGHRGSYASAGLPSTVTTATAILTTPQVEVRTVKVTARVRQTTQMYETRSYFGGATREVIPKNVVLPSGNTTVKEWEQKAAIDWELINPANPSPRAHLTNLSVPTSPDKVTVLASTRDDYGNVTRSQRQVAGGVGEDSAATFDLSAGRIDDWLIHVPETSYVTQIEADDTLAVPHRTTRHLEFDHDEKGRVKTIFTEPGSSDPDLRAVTTMGYGDKGEVRSIRYHSDSSGVLDRETRYEFEPLITGWANEGIYPTQVWSPHSLAAYQPSTWTLTDPATGQPLQNVDRNGTQSSVQHDDLGRPIKSQVPGEAAITTAYSKREDSFGGATGIITTTQRGSEVTQTVTDVLGRPVSQMNNMFNGDGTQAVTTSYDLLGRIVKQSRPYQVIAATSKPTRFTTTTYDSLDRPLDTELPDDTFSSRTYTGLFETRSTDAKGNKSVATSDVNDRPIKNVNVDGKKVSGVLADVITRYAYDPFDLLKSTTDDAGNITSSVYDALGRPTQVSDPDTGIRQLRYTGFGELRDEYHPASLKARSAVFDDLGRMTTGTEYNVTSSGTRIQTGHSERVYDSGDHGIGQIASATSVDNVTTAYWYDEAGRPARVDYTDGPTGPVYRADTTYTDDTGKVDTVTYPAMTPGGTRVTTQYTYNDQGNLTEIGDITPGHIARLWHADSRNLDFNLTQATLGNDYRTNRGYSADTGRLTSITANTPTGVSVMNIGYQYWDNGLVKHRTDTSAGGRDETYDYDSMLRLTDWTLTHGGTTTKTGYVYNPIGNLTATTTNSAVTENNIYGTSGTRPHTLTLTTPTTGPNVAYQYDTQGRLTSGRDRTLTYNSLDLLPRTITNGGRTWNLTYDADGQRVKKASGPDITTYIGDLYEKRQTSTGTSHVFHITGPDGPVAQITYNPAGAPTTTYTLTDRLGSINTTLTNTTLTNTTIDHTYYAPYGNRTNPDGTELTTPPSTIHNGFTGQEHDPELGLINYNGRLYDPTLKHFTTPDPLNSAPLSPYAYINNNPTNGTDPTGYSVLGEGPGTCSTICTSFSNAENTQTTETCTTICLGPDTPVAPPPAAKSDRGSYTGATATDARTAKEIAAQGENSDAQDYANRHNIWSQAQMELPAGPNDGAEGAGTTSDGTGGAGPGGTVWEPEPDAIGAAINATPLRILAVSSHDDPALFSAMLAVLPIMPQLMPRSSSLIRAGGQCGAGGACYRMSMQIAEANPGSKVLRVGRPSKPADAFMPDLPIAHFGVQNLDGTITDVTLLGNALGYNRAGTILPNPAYIKNISSRAARSAATSIVGRDTWMPSDYRALLRNLFPNSRP
ncbi:hypothetical protein G3I17_37750 [Streptomyces sp. SID13031]|nr:hypothetical protein [Streptomyces sp. SID13031]